jgi:Uma2 family endonuclease
MSSVVDSSPPIVWATVADLWERLGKVPLDRICLDPAPGKATQQDLLDLDDHADRICELVEGTLVAKTSGFLEAVVATSIGTILCGFVRDNRLGIVLGTTGPLLILPGQVRVPDACFIAWDRFRGHILPDVPIPAVAPDLAVEVLSEGNTEGEMQRKLRDYFAAGVRLVWYVDPRTRSASVYTSPENCSVVDESGVLTGGDVLPGFELPLRELFAEMDEGSSREG